MSTVADMFTGGKKPKSEPIPTRDDAADANDPDAERRRKLGLGYGAGTLMLSGSQGVPRELTGVRSANG